MPFRVTAVISKPSGGGSVPPPVTQDFPSYAQALNLARSWARDGVQSPIEPSTPPTILYPPLRIDEVKVELV